MTKPLTPTLAICLAATAAMVGALFADPDEPKASGLDETSASQSAEPSASTEPSDDASSEATDHESDGHEKDKKNRDEPTDETTEPTEPSSEPTTDDPGETPSEKPDDYDEDRDGGTDGQNTKSPPADYTMRINNFQIPSVTVAPGDVVKVINNDDVEHTVTADDGSFSTDIIPPGRSRTFTAPTDPGSYGVFCKPHPEMTATITVS